MIEGRVNVSYTNNRMTVSPVDIEIGDLSITVSNQVAEELQRGIDELLYTNCGKTYEHALAACEESWNLLQELRKHITDCDLQSEIDSVIEKLIALM